MRTGVYCTQCATELGDPEEETAHPNDEDPPEDAHFQVQIRDDGAERLQCTTTGRLASPIGVDDDGFADWMEENDLRPDDLDLPVGEEGGGPPQPTESPEKSEVGREPAPVFDLPEEKSPMSILREVVTNPHYGLNDDQINEVAAWADDYDGQIPPDVLEDLIGLMDGVQKQTAQLIRQRYELKLNKYIRENQNSNSGPPIGAGTGSGMHLPVNQTPSAPSPPRPTPQNVEKKREELEEKQKEEEEKKGRFEKKREERKERRRDAVDKAADELAIGTAQNLSSEAGQGMVRLRNLVIKVLESKAEKDPEWFFELQNRLDIDLLDLMEPSEQRKKERYREKNATQAAVDDEIDDVLNELDDEDIQDGVQDEPSNAHADGGDRTSDGWPGQSKPVGDKDPADLNSNPMSASPDDDPVEEEGGEEITVGDIFDE